MDFQIIFESFLDNWLIILLFLIVAILYSSVGFGGGSSYLAILALTGIFFTQIRAIALLCNIVVVSGNIFSSYSKKLDWKNILPLILLSIPFAFFGGKLKINESFFFILLGFTLFFAAITMWISKHTVSSKEKPSKLNFKKNGFFGMVIGFISGMVGIGGGIFLAPLLHLTNWGTPKKIATTASFFILVNSIAGFLGQYSNSDFYIDWSLTSILLLTVFIGGQVGSRISNGYFTPIQLKKATAILIVVVSLRILWQYLF